MPVQYSVIIKMGCGKKIAAAVHIDIIVFYFSKQYNEDKKGVCFYEVSEICRENGLKAGCVACAVRIRSDLPSGKTCRECFFLCHRSTDLIYSWLLHLLRFSISVVAAWSIGWNWAGGLCGVVPVCPVPTHLRVYNWQASHGEPSYRVVSLHCCFLYLSFTLYSAFGMSADSV